MTRSTNAAQVCFIAVDPVQDWEESAEVWGVFGSLEAAMVGVRLLRSREFGKYPALGATRDTEIQQWRGVELVAVWRFMGATEEWGAPRRYTDRAASGP